MASAFKTVCFVLWWFDVIKHARARDRDGDQSSTNWKFMAVEIVRKSKLLGLFLGSFPLCYLIDLYPKQFKKDVLLLLFRGFNNFLMHK